MLLNSKKDNAKQQSEEKQANNADDRPTLDLLLLKNSSQEESSEKGTLVDEGEVSQHEHPETTHKRVFLQEVLCNIVLALFCQCFCVVEVGEKNRNIVIEMFKCCQSRVDSENVAKHQK